MTKSEIFATIKLQSSKKNKNKNKKMIETRVHTNELILSRIGWKYYNSIRKKAMDQEFSWAGLGISLSIAFFIVVFSASFLNATYKSINEQTYQEVLKTNIYQMERADLNRNIV